MRQSKSLYLILSGALLIALLLTVFNPANTYAQNGPAAETPTDQPTDSPTDVPTATSGPGTPNPTATSGPGTPNPTATSAPGTVNPTATSPGGPGTPPASPVSIPEPITVVLFGTGLAALSAAAASRRKNESNKGDE